MEGPLKPINMFDGGWTPALSVPTSKNDAVQGPTINYKIPVDDVKRGGRNFVSR